MRNKQTTVAAVLTLVLGIVGMLDAARILASGSAGAPPMPGAEAMGGPPFAAGLLFMVIGVAMVFGAFGLWKNQKWGRVVAIVTCGVYGLFTLGDLLGAIMLRHYGLALLFAVAVLACLAVIVLALRRDAGPRLPEPPAA